MKCSCFKVSKDVKRSKDPYSCSFERDPHNCSLGIHMYA